MAVKIIRHPKKIAILGSATSAAASRAGSERAPAALRAAGLADRLKLAGFEVADSGNTATALHALDDEHPRARNIPAILKSLNDLRPRIEVAIKSGALPLILCGDCISVLATIAGARRYYRNVSLIYIDRDVDLNIPTTSVSGYVDGMAIAHVIGLGAPELIRFWGEPPLVRETDIALFGFARLDPPEERYLTNSSLRRHSATEVASSGAANAALKALERVHAAQHQFILHFDIDVISGAEFPATNFPGDGGLSWEETKDALRVFVAQPNLLAIEVAGYNPELDPDGEAGKRLVDLLTDVLASRLEPASTILTGDSVPVEATPAGSESVSSESAPMPESGPSEPGDASVENLQELGPA